MSKLTRREFSELVGAAGIAATTTVAMTTPVVSQVQPKVVIVGGGAGGASVARRLKESAPEIDVTLIEASRKYSSPFLSEHFLGGFRSLNSLTHGYDGLAAAGVNVVTSRASKLDAKRRLVFLSDESSVAYDKLVMSPGVDFRTDTIEGYTPQLAQRIPHAWRNGAQNIELRNQLLDMKDGGTVVMTVPLGAIRGGSAPYTRASMVAHYLKYHKPKSKLILLDSNRDFAQRDVFEEAWSEHYEGILEHRLSATAGQNAVVRVDANTLELDTRDGERMKAAVLSVVPEQTAGAFAHAAGCVEKAWCPVDAATFESRLVKDVHVLGDAADLGVMPKTAFAANSQAVAVANHLASELVGKKKFPVRFRNAQWSLLATNNAIKSGATYVLGKGGVVEASTFASATKETEAVRARNFEESLNWYDAMTRDMFGTG